MDFDILTNKEEKFLWCGHGVEAYDGSTILWILFSIYNPSIRVGVLHLKEDIKDVVLEKFILECRLIHEDFMYNLFYIFEIVPRANFAACVCDETQKWELDEEKKTDDVLAEALAILNNTISINYWDPKDIKNHGSNNGKG